METHYIIDSGNTNLKVAEFSPAGKLQRKYHIEKMAELNISAPSVALFCSVKEKISNSNSQLFDFEKIKGQLNFKTEYTSELGNDRFALTYGISKLFNDENFIAIDAGSFITIDIMSNGIHKGGFIYPGLQTFLKSYNLHGENLPLLNDVKSSSKKIAQCTNEAISMATENYLRQIRNHILEFGISSIYVTGGDADYFNFDSVKKDKDLLEKALHIILKEIIS